MRIGELAQRVGVTTDTVRFYERAGWLPRPARRDNSYREYDEADVDHLRLLIDLRRLEMPLQEAAQVAAWCHSGHCADATAQLPGLIERQRTQIAERIERLRALDQRLAGLQAHLRAESRLVPLVQLGACCEAASAVVASSEGGCACCAAAN